jgi:hypothetical protein
MAMSDTGASGIDAAISCLGLALAGAVVGLVVGVAGERSRTRDSLAWVDGRVERALAKAGGSKVRADYRDPQYWIGTAEALHDLRLRHVGYPPLPWGVLGDMPEMDARPYGTAPTFG